MLTLIKRVDLMMKQQDVGNEHSRHDKDGHKSIMIMTVSTSIMTTKMMKILITIWMLLMLKVFTKRSIL